MTDTPEQFAKKVRRGLGAGERLVPGTMSQEEHEAGIALDALLARLAEAQETIRMHDAQAGTFLARAEAAEARLAEAERMELWHQFREASTANDKRIEAALARLAEAERERDKWAKAYDEAAPMIDEAHSAKREAEARLAEAETDAKRGLTYREMLRKAEDDRDRYRAALERIERNPMAHPGPSLIARAALDPEQKP